VVTRLQAVEAAATRHMSCGAAITRAHMNSPSSSAPAAVAVARSRASSASNSATCDSRRHRFTVFSSIVAQWPPPPPPGLEVNKAEEEAEAEAAAAAAEAAASTIARAHRVAARGIVQWCYDCGEAALIADEDDNLTTVSIPASVGVCIMLSISF
jgi:hypothetical protein